MSRMGDVVILSFAIVVLFMTATFMYIGLKMYASNEWGLIPATGMFAIGLLPWLHVAKAALPASPSGTTGKEDSR